MKREEEGKRREKDGTEAENAVNSNTVTKIFFLIVKSLAKFAAFLLFSSRFQTFTKSTDQT